MITLRREQDKEYSLFSVEETEAFKGSHQGTQFACEEVRTPTHSSISSFKTFLHSSVPGYLLCTGPWGPQASAVLGPGTL